MTQRRFWLSNYTKSHSGLRTKTPKQSLQTNSRRSSANYHSEKNHSEGGEESDSLPRPVFSLCPGTVMPKLLLDVGQSHEQRFIFQANGPRSKSRAPPSFPGFPAGPAGCARHVVGIWSSRPRHRPWRRGGVHNCIIIVGHLASTCEPALCFGSGRKAPLSCCHFR